MSSDSFDQAVQRAAALFGDADGLLITAGAGIGVDSGLPDFRGPQGFWSVYPALGRARIAFEQIANPQAFTADPRLAWGFYGHRLALYRRTVPHEGFALLQRFADRLPQGAFVYTSNVDGQFQKAGFDESRIVECHGSIHHLQCFDACRSAIWPADDFQPVVDEAACRLTGDLPRCPQCRGIARPNILMFGDWAWQSTRSDDQETRL
ncbi:MAG TPA: Sir2 family NAD-dependent protein deacetylase, partial [Accumulibacter sp.]|nr:Sir2 family NAD-dependent protein deacetylase [Accumulibacter sp.]